MNASRKTREELNYICSEIKARFDFADKHAEKAASLRLSAVMLIESIADQFPSQSALLAYVAGKTKRHVRTIYKYLALENCPQGNSQPPDTTEKSAGEKGRSRKDVSRTPNWHPVGSEAEDR